MHDAFDDNLDAYFREVSEHDVLTAEQELALAQDIERRETAAWVEVLAVVPVGRAILAGPLTRIERELAGRAGLERALADARGVAAAARVVADELVRWDKQRRLRLAIIADLRRDGGGRLGAAVAPDALARLVVGVDRVEALARRAREAFITANLRLVVLIARRFRGRGLALSDLVQEGNLGLMRAVDGFDYRKGFRFSTFASWWIMASVRRAVLDKGRTVRLPVHLIDEQRRLRKLGSELATRLGRAATEAELCAAAEMSPERLAEIEGAFSLHAISLDKPTGDDDDGSAHDFVVDPEADATPVPERIHMEAVKRELERLVGGLSPVEADIIRRRYGMGDADEQTLQEIGEDYDRSRERIRQIESRALAKLRRALRRADRPGQDADGDEPGYR